MIPRKTFAPLAATLTLICSLCAGAAEYRTFTSSDGRTLSAKVLECTPEQDVTIETEAGQRFKNVPLERFSKEDREYIKEWEAKRIAAFDDADLKKDTDLQMFVRSSRDDELNDTGDPDNMDVEYEPAITFENREKDYSFKAVEGILVFIGQSVLDKNEFHILYREAFTIDLPKGGERVYWKGKPFTNTYDDNPRNGSAFGAKYEGYLLVLYNKSGEATIIKASKSKWEECISEILKASMRKAYDRSFSNEKNKSVI